MKNPKNHQPAAEKALLQSLVAFLYGEQSADREEEGGQTAPVQRLDTLCRRAGISKAQLLKLLEDPAFIGRLQRLSSSVTQLDRLLVRSALLRECREGDMAAIKLLYDRTLSPAPSEQGAGQGLPEVEDIAAVRRAVFDDGEEQP